MSYDETVAPHAGAWIETYTSKQDCLVNDVAPHAGAWIETSISKVEKLDRASRASRRRVD